MRELDDLLITEGTYKTTFKWSFPERRALRRKKLKCGPGFKVSEVNGVPMCVPESGLEKVNRKIGNRKGARTFKGEGPTAARIKKSKFRKAYRAGQMAGVHEEIVNELTGGKLLKEGAAKQTQNILSIFRRFFSEVEGNIQKINNQKLSTRADVNRAIERWDGIIKDYAKLRNIQVVVPNESGKAKKNGIADLVDEYLPKVISYIAIPSNGRSLFTFFNQIISDEKHDLTKKEIKVIFDYILKPEDIGIDSPSLFEASYIDRLRGATRGNESGYEDSFLFSCAMMLLFGFVASAAAGNNDAATSVMTPIVFNSANRWVMTKLNPTQPKAPDAKNETNKGRSSKG
jgi:hypothetical protein